MTKFDIVPASNYIWNQLELIDFLLQNQGHDIMLTTNAEGCCCCAIGLYDLLDKFQFKSVTIVTANPFEHHDHYQIKSAHSWRFLSVSTAVEDRYHCWNKRKIFGTIYGRPLWHRIGIAAHLLVHHRRLSLIGCRADVHNVDNRELFEVSRLFQHDPDSLQKFSSNWQQFPMLLKNLDRYTPGEQHTDGYISQTKRVYADFLIDIVAETFTDGDCFFVTEKTVRPMMLKKPFIIFGSKHYLLYLRRMGFRTFADFWNEDYDGYEGRERFVRILDLIDSLAQKSKDELERMYWGMQYSLDHNYNLLLNQSYNRTINFEP